MEISALTIAINFIGGMVLCLYTVTTTRNNKDGRFYPFFLLVTGIMLLIQGSK